MPGTGADFESCAGGYSAGKGRGGLRVIYYHFRFDSQIWLDNPLRKTSFGSDNERKESTQSRNRSELAARAARRIAGAHRERDR